MTVTITAITESQNYDKMYKAWSACKDAGFIPSEIRDYFGGNEPTDNRTQQIYPASHESIVEVFESKNTKRYTIGVDSLPKNTKEIDIIIDTWEDRND